MQLIKQPVAKKKILLVIDHSIFFNSLKKSKSKFVDAFIIGLRLEFEFEFRSESIKYFDSRFSARVFDNLIFVLLLMQKYLRI